MEEDEYSIHEVAAEVGVGERTLHYWMSCGLLQPPPFRGWATVYGRDYVARAKAIKALRDEGLSTAQIGEELAARDRAAKARALAAAAATTAAREAAPALAAPAHSVSEGATRPPPPLAPYPSEPWERIVLVPGLELHVNLAGGQILRRMAREIYSHYGPPLVDAPKPE